VRSLFLKIFLSYWMAQALFVVSAIVVTLAMRPQTDSARWEYFRISIGTQAAQAYEKGGAAQVTKDIGDIERALRDQIFLFDERGAEVTGRFVPAWARELAAGTHAKPNGYWQALESGRRAAQPITSPNGKHYTVVVERPVLPRVFFSPNHTPGLGIVIAVLCSGLVCFLLARYLTAPVVRLRAATQRLADGDLTARAGDLGSRRGDEIAQLVRDFDSMASRLEALVTAQSRLLNDISHELRSPLARLNVALGLARQRTGPEATATLDRIEREASRLNELIGRLLALARMEGGEASTQMSDVHLRALLEGVVEDADFESQGRNCRVSCEILDDCVVSGNTALLHSAIENVVRNAMRYTGEGTEVEIRLECLDNANGPEACIRVSDHGPGVPEAALDKLFRPFYRVDSARERQTGGIGLGLAITDRAVRLHGGSVRAANRPGGGLVVEIRLPAQVRRAAEPATAAASLSAVKD
jgi:two-component system, OmpR family, sensor histidine kinase CpxA